MDMAWVDGIPGRPKVAWVVEFGLAWESRELLGR